MTEDERDDLLVSDHIDRFNAETKAAADRRDAKPATEEPNP